MAWAEPDSPSSPLPSVASRAGEQADDGGARPLLSARAGSASAPLQVRARHGKHGQRQPAALASFRLSQRNLFTGKLTEPVPEAVFGRAAELAGNGQRKGGEGGG